MKGKNDVRHGKDETAGRAQLVGKKDPAVLK